ncbi:AtzG-like protein [Xanthobacteraceae bacterium A53D]
MSDPTPMPRLSDEAVAQLLDAGIAAFALNVAPEWRDVAFTNLRTIADAAQFVLAADLGDEAEPAAVFRP